MSLVCESVNQSWRCFSTIRTIFPFRFHRMGGCGERTWPQRREAAVPEKRNIFCGSLCKGQKVWVMSDRGDTPLASGMHARKSSNALCWLHPLNDREVFSKGVTNIFNACRDKNNWYSSCTSYLKIILLSLQILPKSLLNSNYTSISVVFLFFFY